MEINSLSETEVLVLSNENEKVCAHCGRLLPDHCFNRSSKSKDGLQSWCRECQRSFNRKYYTVRQIRTKEYENLDISTILFGAEALTKGQLTDTVRMLERATACLRKIIEDRKKK